jgi:hypothetical protein
VRRCAGASGHNQNIHGCLLLQHEAPYTPRHDFQGISDDADLQAIMARLPQFTTAR